MSRVDVALSRMSVDGSKDRMVDDLAMEKEEEVSRVEDEEDDAIDRAMNGDDDDERWSCEECHRFINVVAIFDVGIDVVVENADTKIGADDDDERPSILNFIGRGAMFLITFFVVIIMVAMNMIAWRALNR